MLAGSARSFAPRKPGLRYVNAKTFGKVRRDMDDMLHQVAVPAQWRTGVVFASPHSGRVYSDAFMAQTSLSRLAIRSSEDAYVDDLLAGVPELGAPVLMAHAPRSYVDLNRAASELDPALIAGAPRGRHNPRVSSGLGVIPRVVAERRRIYSGKLPLEEAQARINAIWMPYHAELATLMDLAFDGFGWAILIDVHSMPSGAHGQLDRPSADIVLGDRYGASAAPRVTDAIEAAFVRAGFSVARNAPFAGAYIVQTYGQPLRGRHCVQVEIDRGLYLNEALVEKSEGFGELQQRLAGVWAEIAAIGVREGGALAAE